MVSARSSRWSGWAGLIVGVLVWQEGGESVAALLAIGVGGDGRRSCTGSFAASARARPTLLDPTLVQRRSCSRPGSTQIFLQQVALGGMLIALPIYLQLVWGYNASRRGSRWHRCR